MSEIPSYAYPFIEQHVDDNGQIIGITHHGGLTKLEWLQGMALHGLLANPNTTICNQSDADRAVYAAKQIAGALLTQGDKP